MLLFWLGIQLPVAPQRMSANSENPIELATTQRVRSLGYLAAAFRVVTTFPSTAAGTLPCMVVAPCAAVNGNPGDLPTQG